VQPGFTAAVIYFSLRTFPVPAATRILTTLALIWVYILVAGAPPSAIRAGVVATLVLAAGLRDRAGLAVGHQQAVH
jgi:competence protein ComEC